MNLQDNNLLDQRTTHTTLASPQAGLDEGPMAVLAGAAIAARRRAAPLAIWVAFCLAAAGWYLHSTPPAYTAGATVILDPKRPAIPLGDSATGSLVPTLDSAAAESQLQVIRSERLLSFVFDTLDLANASSLRPAPPSFWSQVLKGVAGLFRTPRDSEDEKAAQAAAAFDTFTSRVGARRVGQSYVIEVSYTSGDPTEARRLANAVVSGYLGQQVSFKLAAAQNGAEFLQSRITSLSNEVKAASAGMLAGTVPATLLPDADARVIGAALEPLGRSAPKSGLVVGFAAAFGLLSGVFGVAVMNSFDRRIRSADQLEKMTGVPCVGEIPDVRRRKRLAKRPFAEMASLARSEPDGRFASSMRDTRTSILLAMGGKHGHALGITSWSDRGGCSLVACNLAEVIALSGAHVTLVDADIHRSEGGLTALVGPVDTSLTESLLDPTGVTVANAVQLNGELYLVAARSDKGARGHDAYLGAPGLPYLIEAWRAHGEIVVDLPALSSGGDARAAAARLDGVVLVVEVGTTTVADVERAFNALSRAGAVIVGTILNRVQI